MRYRRLGGSGLKLSELTLGSWLTFGPRVDEAGARASVRLALEKGVNSFDTAETYADGAAEELLGRAIEGIRRESLVVATKLFWGGPGPNDVGLSRKRIVEGTRGSLRRLRLDYVDLLYCHRPDPDTPIEETVRAMDSVVRSGQALYWGTSEWPASAIEEAYRVAKELGCAPPTMEQSKHHLFARARL
ncbi:MAG TPA: aldo/keto reductase, partial [Planctomycetota bacterium]|nr:aldo/keto reductase [Planctomycetota bacterium]